MAKPLSVEIASDHLLPCLFLCLLWAATTATAATNSTTATTATNSTTASTVTITTTATTATNSTTTTTASTATNVTVTTTATNSAIAKAANLAATTTATNSTTTPISSQTETTTISTTRSPPANVKDLKSVGQNETSITLQWTKVNGSNYYLLRYRDSDQEKNVTVNSENPSVTYVASNLKSGTKYNFTLFTLDGNLASTGVNHSAVTAPPNAEDFKSVGQNETSITFQWENGNATYNYILKFKNEEKNVTGDGTMRVTYTVSDLTSGTEYNFVLFTVFENVRSSGVNLSAVTAPPNAEDFKSVGQNETSITLQWKSRNAMYNYILKFKNEEKNVTGNKDNKVTYVASDLESGTRYNFTLFTVFENVRSTGVNLGAVTVPRNAEMFQSVGQNETSITLQWKKVDGMVNYILEVNNKETNVTGIEANEKVTYVVPELENGTKYNFTLFTEIGNVRSSGVSLTAVTAPTNAEDFTAVGQNETSITLQWKRVQGILDYTLAFNKKSINISAVGDRVTHSIVQLQSGTEYNFTLFTKFENVSSSGRTLLAVTAPENVKNVTVSGQNESSITLTWKKVNNISTYALLYGTQGNSINTITFPQEVTHVVTLLNPGKNYHFVLTTVFGKVNSTGYRFNASTVPSKVHWLNVTKRDVTSVNLTWNNGDSTWSYLVRVNGIDEKSVDSVNSSNVSYSVSPLKPGTAYTISVITNFNGLSSAAYNVSTVTAIDCAIVPWNVTSSSIQGRVEGLFSNATASNATRTHVSPGGSDVTFADLYPGATYEISLLYQQYEQCRHSLTIPPPGLMAHCEYLASGYSIKIVWNKPDGVWTAVEMNVSGRTYSAGNQSEQHYTIHGFQPAKHYTVSLISLSGSVRSSTAFVFTCSTDPRGVIAGSVLGVMFFLLICLAVFILFRRPDLIRKKAFIGGSILSFKKCKAISVEKFEDHLFNLSMDDNRGFSLEYERLAPVGTEQTQKAAVQPENKPKNRFNNVLPYDWSRVRLTAHPGGTSDYINANYMPGFNSNREYIATQGPLPTTVCDFWRMIWEQRVTGIVMVTNCTEGGRTKCEQYWPAYRNPCLYDQVEVTVRAEQQEPNWTLRDFVLKHKNTSDSRAVKHFHFTAWPDHGVPQSTGVLIQFRQLVRRHIEREGTGAPTVVHCSAGVGRTGTIIALDVLLQELDKKGAVGINAFVHKMRLSRPHMVQTESQYVFLHQCIMDALHPCENTEENIYENTEGIYVNATALREFRNNTNA
ncbi:hypothetical protein Q5P01_023260 [Channa striata]|uniref:protein-tyrosine-phosphatase n=1 Tax=Channa striata TaxID=64152 RepID=A0AA88ISV1_CHASR|nr:hypothetical protein Q5P01_023260 [Channa striata]